MEDRVGRPAVSFEAFTLGTTVLHFPQMGRNAEFGTELGDCTVDGNTAHDRNNRLNFVLGPFEVEQNLEVVCQDEARCKKLQMNILCKI